MNSPDNHAQQEQEEQDDVYSPITQNKINNADKGVIESLKLANQFASRWPDDAPKEEDWSKQEEP